MFREKLSAIEFIDIEIITGLLSNLKFSVVCSYINKTKISILVKLTPKPLQEQGGKIILSNHIPMPIASNPDQEAKYVRSVYIKCDNVDDFKFNLTCGLFKIE